MNPSSKNPVWSERSVCEANWRNSTIKWAFLEHPMPYPHLHWWSRECIILRPRTHQEATIDQPMALPTPWPTARWWQLTTVGTYPCPNWWRCECIYLTTKNTVRSNHWSTNGPIHTLTHSPLVATNVCGLPHFIFFSRQALVQPMPLPWGVGLSFRVWVQKSRANFERGLFQEFSCCLPQAIGVPNNGSLRPWEGK